MSNNNYIFLLLSYTLHTKHKATLSLVDSHQEENTYIINQSFFYPYLFNTLSARGSDQLKFINPKVLKPAEVMFKFMYFNTLNLFKFYYCFGVRGWTFSVRDDRRCLSRLIVMVGYAFTIRETRGKLCLRE